jgi:DNA invertase Pin-like site-specific DNA recombinase
MKTAEQPFVARESQVASAPLRRNQDLPRFSSSKIRAEQLEKLAIVYVRQSTPRQVMEHRESRERQYALANRARALGWPEERVLLIDEDQGQTGTRADNRAGFQRLLAEVTLNHVGIVLGLEMSRLARSSQDWHQLFELCGIFETLLADDDGVYNPNDHNDRILLGLKGIMSEVELQTMRNRLERGRLNKAQRGELFCSMPAGYVILPNGEVALDPDEQARAVVQLVFEKFAELGSVRAVFLWFTRQGIQLPMRAHQGPHKGQLEWRRPRLVTLNRMLNHPLYAGAYAYGRTAKKSKQRQVAGQARSYARLPMDQWQILIRDRLPAYISWDDYQRNQVRIKQNQPRPNTMGTPRNGCALLSGLLICGHCGWRMRTDYHTRERHQYSCQRHLEYAKETLCFSLKGKLLDRLVSDQVLTALEPAALELSLQAQTDVRRERERLNRHWQQNLKRARYEVDSAERCYRAVDPENRLVAATLERQWEQALRQERALQEEYDRFRQQNHTELTADELSHIMALASDIPALWNSPQTTHADRQSIIRCLLEQVVLHGDRNSEHVAAVIHWKGGYESRLEFRRPVGSYHQLRDYDELEQRITELWESGHSASRTAEALNAEGFVPIDPTQVFSPVMVHRLRSKLGLLGQANNLPADEWSLIDLAKHLQMRSQTLRAWVLRGWVHGCQPGLQRRWILWADQDEMSRLRELLASTSQGKTGYPPSLTTPKPRAT